MMKLWWNRFGLDLDLTPFLINYLKAMILKSVSEFSSLSTPFEITQQVSKSVSYQSAAGNACPTGQSGEELQIYHAFTLIYRKHEAAIGRHVAQFEDIR